MLHPAIWNARFFAVSLCGNQSPFGTYNAAYSRKMLQVGVRTLTSSCFGFACARAQGTRHRRKRQVPCPLSKKIGRNRLQEFKHSFNQKMWPGVKNNQSSVSGFPDLPDGSPLLHSLSLKYEHLWRLISFTTSLTFLESSLSNCSKTNCKQRSNSFVRLL